MTPFKIHSTHEINGVAFPSRESAERSLNATNAIFKLFETHDLSAWEIEQVGVLLFPQLKGNNDEK